MSDCRHIFTHGLGPDVTGRASIWRCDDCHKLGVVICPPPPGASDPTATLRDDLGRAVEALRRAVDVTEVVHDSWRCGYPERYQGCSEEDPQCETQQERKAWRSLLAKLEGGR